MTTAVQKTLGTGARDESNKLVERLGDGSPCLSLEQP